MMSQQQDDTVVSDTPSVVQPQAPQAPRPAMPAIGFDSGLKNAASGGILFYGAQELCGGDEDDEDDASHTSTKTIPVFDITCAERLDVTTGMIYRPSADWQSIERVVADPPSIKGTKLKEMAAHITQMVPRSPWMFEPAPSLLDGGKTMVLPMLVVENQPPRQAMENRKKDSEGTKKQADGAGATTKQPMDFRNDVLGPVAQHWGNTILTCDAVKFGAGGGTDGSHQPLYPKRERVGAMSKYGLRCDGSRDRPERKEESVDSLLELLSELGTPNSLQWFNWFTLMQEKGEQIHDMCDAISLAVQYCFMQYKKFAKAELRKLELSQKEDMKKRKALLNNIRQSAIRPKKAGGRKKKGADGVADIAFPDDNDGSNTPVKKKRAPAKKTKQATKGKKKAASSSSLEDDEGEEGGNYIAEPVKKKRAPRKKVASAGEDQGKKKRKRSKSTKNDNDEMDDGDDVVILSSSSPTPSDEMNKDPVKKRAKKVTQPELKYPILLSDEPLKKSGI